MADTDNKENEVPPIGVDPKSLYQIEPIWRTDGYGIRGPQDEVSAERATPSSMEFGQSYPHSGTSGGGGGGPCAPTPPPGSGTWIWGAVDGVCQWIDTTTCS